MLRRSSKLRARWPPGTGSGAAWPPTARMMRSACQLRPSTARTVCGSMNRTGPSRSIRSMPRPRIRPATSFLSWAWWATRELLATTASRSRVGRSPRRPNWSQEDQSRTSRAARARVRTGAGPRLRLVPPTCSASSRVTAAPSSRACSDAEVPAGPPPMTSSFIVQSPAPGSGAGRPGHAQAVDAQHDGWYLRGAAGAGGHGCANSMITLMSSGARRRPACTSSRPIRRVTSCSSQLRSAAASALAAR